MHSVAARGQRAGVNVTLADLLKPAGLTRGQRKSGQLQSNTQKPNRIELPTFGDHLFAHTGFLASLVVGGSLESVATGKNGDKRMLCRRQWGEDCWSSSTVPTKIFQTTGNSSCVSKLYHRTLPKGSKRGSVLLYLFSAPPPALRLQMPHTYTYQLQLIPRPNSWILKITLFPTATNGRSRRVHWVTEHLRYGLIILLRPNIHKNGHQLLRINEFWCVCTTKQVIYRFTILKTSAKRNVT